MFLPRAAWKMNEAATKMTNCNLIEDVMLKLNWVEEFDQSNKKCVFEGAKMMSISRKLWNVCEVICEIYSAIDEEFKLMKFPHIVVRVKSLDVLFRLTRGQIRVRMFEYSSSFQTLMSAFSVQTQLFPYLCRNLLRNLI